MKSCQKYVLALASVMAACALLMGCQSAEPPAEDTESHVAEQTAEQDTVEATEPDETDANTEANTDTEETEMTEKPEWKPTGDGIYLVVDPSAQGAAIGNKVSDMNVWSHTAWSKPLQESYMAEVYPFVENMQFMTATGGEYGRDLFVNPSDTTVLDDYNFEPLINSCRNVGRILSGSKRLNSSELTGRIVGHTKQAAYDAMVLNLMVEEDIDYFSSWGYLTDHGLPTVSYHVANEFYKMVGTTCVESTMKRYADGGSRDTSRFWDALTSTDGDGNLYVMAYAFGETQLKESDKQLRVMTDLDCQKARITISYVNDDANFFDDWVALCEEYELGRRHFSWSPDSTQLPGNLITDRAWKVYSDNLTEGVVLWERTKLKSKTVEVDVTDGKLDFTTDLDLNTAVFLKIEPMA